MFTPLSLLELEGPEEMFTCWWQKLMDEQLTTHITLNKQRQAKGEEVYKSCKLRATHTDKENVGMKSAEFIGDGPQGKC